MQKLKYDITKVIIMQYMQVLCNMQISTMQMGYHMHNVDYNSVKKKMIGIVTLYFYFIKSVRFNLLFFFKVGGLLLMYLYWYRHPHSHFHHHHPSSLLLLLQLLLHL